MSQDTNQLAGSSWSVVEIDGVATIETVQPNLVFAEDGRLSGSGGVNRLMGSYQFEDGAIEIAPVGSTRMAGPPEAMEQEDRLLKILPDRFNITNHNGGGLLLQSAEHTLRLVAETRPSLTVSGSASQIEQSSVGLVRMLSLGESQFEFRAGEPIPTTLVLANHGDQPVARFYRDAQRYDFVISTVEEKARGEEVWRWSANQAFLQALGEETFEPLKTVSYTEVWDQLDNDGRKVPPGRYEALAVDVGCEDEERSQCYFESKVFFEIVP